MIVQCDIDPRFKLTKKKLDDIIDLPRVVVVNEFTEKAALQFRDDVSEAVQTGQDAVPVVIDSYGGLVHSLTSMVDTLKSCPVPVVTVATGKAMSCGAALFTCGTEGMRYISPSATLMIHDVSSGMFGKVGDMEVRVEETKRLNQWLYDMMDDNIGKPRGYIQGIVGGRHHRDWYLTAHQALEHNVANHVGVPRLKVSLGISTTFEGV